MSTSEIRKKLVNYIIEKKIWWFGEIAELCNKYNFSAVDIYTGKDKNYIDQSLNVLKIEFNRSLVLRRDQSSFYVMYKQLNMQPLANNYMCDENKQHFISIIIKVRGELLGLNYSVIRGGGGKEEVSLCNFSVVEDVYHFAAECPILSEWRQGSFQVNRLERAIFLLYLNGDKNWLSLYKFVSKAFKYRKILIDEFNF